MDWVLGMAATLVGVFVFLNAVAFLVQVARLVKMRMWEAACVTIPRSEQMAEWPLFEAARLVLEREGFAYQATRRKRMMFFSIPASIGHSEIYYNAQLDVRAEVVPASLPTPRNCFDIFLGNSYADGSHLVTVDGLAHMLCHYPSSVTLVDAYAGDFQAQLAAHLAARDKKPGQLTPADQAEVVALDKENRMIALLEQDGKVYRRGEYKSEPLYGFRLRQAFRMAWRMRIGSFSRSWMEDGAEEARPEDAADLKQVAQRIAFVRTLCALHGNEAPRWFRWSTFGVTAAGFLALGAWLWDMRLTLVIGAVIVVHEAGHWLAMKSARFRDVQVFFVPGMGGATSGEKHDASPLTHLAVYMAGPLPGILLALGVLAGLVLGQADTSAAWYAPVVAGALVTLVLNLLNLLPVMPLDGGRIVDLFVLGRLPWLRFVFVTASALLLVWSGVARNDRLLLCLGIVMLLAVPHQYRIATLSRHLLRRVAEAPHTAQPFAATAEQLFDILAQPAYQRWSHESKVGVGLSLLPRFLGRVPTLKETALGLTIYMVSLGLPLAVLAGLAFKDPQRVFGFAAAVAKPSVSAKPAAATKTEDPVAALRAQRAAMLADAGEGSERRAALVSAIDDAGAAEDFDDELRLTRLLYQESEALDPVSNERADAMMRLGFALLANDDAPAQKESPPLLAGAERILRARLARERAGADALMLARLLEWQPSGPGKNRQIARWEEIVSLRAAHAAQAGLALPQSRVAMARALDADERHEDALTQLSLASSDIEQVAHGASYYRSSLMLDRAWFHFAHGRPSEALLTAAPLVEDDGNEAPGNAQLVREARMLAAIEARTRSDWQAVDARLSDLQRIAPVKTGKWLTDRFVTWFARRPPDVRVTLLLIEAKRAMGKNEHADTLVLQLRKSYRTPPKGNPSCRFSYPGDPWRQALRGALSTVEKRELRCVDKAR